MARTLGDSIYRSMPLVFAFLLLFSLHGLVHSETTGSHSPVYKLSKGDKFSIYVFEEPDLSLSTSINDEGTIFYPLLGEIPVAGLSPDELEKDLTKRLKGDYLVNPQVSVTMQKYRDYFIGGAVNSPGWHQYEPGMTFQQAVDKAGGFSPVASRRKLYVHQEGETSDDREKVELDYIINPNDSLFVGESFF